jgi:hypothetical protein
MKMDLGMSSISNPICDFQHPFCGFKNEVRKLGTESEYFDFLNLEIKPPLLREDFFVALIE